jgi:hypothetical protein
VSNAPGMFWRRSGAETASRKAYRLSTPDMTDRRLLFAKQGRDFRPVAEARRMEVPGLRAAYLVPSQAQRAKAVCQAVEAKVPADPGREVWGHPDRLAERRVRRVLAKALPVVADQYLDYDSCEASWNKS